MPKILITITVDSEAGIVNLNSRQLDSEFLTEKPQSVEAVVEEKQGG